MTREERAAANHLFDREIVPFLNRSSLERAASGKTRLMRYGLSTLMLFGLTVVFCIIAERNGVSAWIPISLGVLGLFFVIVFAEAPAAAARDKMMETFMAAICRQDGHIDYKRRDTDDFPVSLFTDAKLVLKPETSLLEDLIIGDHKNIHYEIVEAMLMRGSGENRTAVQHDKLLLHARGLPAIEGYVALYDRQDKLQSIVDRLAIGARAGTRVFGIDEKLEARYAVFASAPDIARRYLTQDLVEKILQLPEVIGTLSMNLALTKDHLLIAADPPRGGLFPDHGPYREIIDPTSSEHELREQFQILYQQSRLGRAVLDTLLSSNGADARS